LKQNAKSLCHRWRANARRGIRVALLFAREKIAHLRHGCVPCVIAAVVCFREMAKLFSTAEMKRIVLKNLALK
jgi:hypothetical protein